MARLGDFSTGFDAARVIAWRLDLMRQATLHPSLRTSAEMVRMVTEKQTAFAMGLLGAQQAMASAWLKGMWEVQKAAVEIGTAAEAPALKTLRRNVRRASRRR